MTARPPRQVVAALISCAALAFGGCASVSDRAQNSSLEALDPTLPPGPSSTTKPVKCSDTSFSSLAPSALPRPGHMPADTFMRDIQDRGHLIAGVDQNSKGLAYFNPITSRIEGFDIDMVREVARAIFGRPSIVYKAISTKQRESVIVNNEVDIVASAYSIACDRQRRMLFSSVYARAQQRLLVPRNSSVDRLSDLRGKKVCATVGSTSVKRLQGEVGVVPYPVAVRSDCLVALQEGDVAAITGDDTILFGFKQQDDHTRIVGPCLGIERYGMAINKAHRRFVPFVNAVLAKLRRDGKTTAFRERWLKGLRPPTAAEISQCSHRRTGPGTR